MQEVEIGGSIRDEDELSILVTEELLLQGADKPPYDIVILVFQSSLLRNFFCKSGVCHCPKYLAGILSILVTEELLLQVIFFTSFDEALN